MNDDPLVLANRLRELGDAGAAARVLETALFSAPEREDIRRRFDELVAELPSEEALSLLERRRRLSEFEVPSRRKQVLLVLAGAVALIGAAAWTLGPGAGMLIAGMASCAAVARTWSLRVPLRWHGSEIRHAERPFSYHACCFALFMFSVLFLGAGLLSTFGAVR
jgi:hypothetical protein